MKEFLAARSWVVFLMLVLVYGTTSLAQLPVNNGVPVHYEGVELFKIHASTADLDVAERAAVIERRLVILAEDEGLQPDPFKLGKIDSLPAILYKGERVLRIYTADAEAHGLGQQEASELYLTQIKQGLVSRQAWQYMKSILINLLLALLVILVLVFMVRYMNRLFRFLGQRLIRTESPYIRSIRIRNYEFLSKERLVALLSTALSGLKWLLIVLAVYISLPVLFSIFPGTEGIARSLFSLIFSPLRKIFTAFIGYLPNLFTIGVILVVIRYGVQFLHFLAVEVRDKKLILPGFYPDWALPTYQILRFVLWAFGFIMIFPYLPGSNSPIFQGVSVFLGLLVSFGSGSAIANAVAGIAITYMRPFRKGDRVRIGEVTGDVIEKSLLVTRIRTIKNEEITVPNSAVLNGHTINYTTAAEDRGLILYTTVTIGYDVPWKKVHEALIHAALDAEGVEKDPKPFVLQTSLDDFYVSYQLNCYTRQPAKSAVWYSNIHSNIQDRFNEAGIEILSPHYRAARDGNMVTIPAEYLPSDYVPPHFNLKMQGEDPAGPK